MSVTAPSALSFGASRTSLLASLGDIVGTHNVLTGDGETRRYRTGYRFGSGRVLAVVRPGTLVEQWRVLAACVAARAIVITQASNTGLTGGSTPDGDGYDRDIVIVSTTRIKRVHLIKGGSQVVCIGGTTLDQLERALEAARTRAAFGDRLVVHRRIGAGRHQQQLGRLARASRAGLYGDGACSPPSMHRACCAS